MSKPYIHTTEKEICYHCGSSIDGLALESNSLSFCCEGCKNVYILLADNNLCDFYELEQNPGNSLGAIDINDEYAFLDEPAIQSELLDYQDEQRAKVRLILPQIHCSSCIWLLENLHKINSGIESSRVNFINKEIDLTFSKTLGLRKVVEQLVKFGYVPQFNLNTAKNKNLNKKVDRTLYYKLGVAGFCFGNIMVASFPEYLGIIGEFTNEFTQTFRYMNAFFAIPVVFYSGNEYLQNGYNAMKTKVLNLDVPIAVGIITLLITSIYEVISKTGSGYFDSLAGFIFFLLLGKFFQQKTYNYLSFERDFKSFFPLSVNRIRGGKSVATKITELLPGDIIELKNNEILPCDAVLTEANAVFDFSFVTGETDLVTKNENSFVYAGGKLKSPSAQFMVSKKAEEGYLAALWQQTISQHSQKSLGNLADNLGKNFTYVILFISLITVGVWLIIDPSRAFTIFTSVLIVACPCALALTIPFSFGTAMRHLAKKGMFLKDSNLLETMSKVNHLVFDKTGTLSKSGLVHLTFEGELDESELSQIAFLAKHSTHPLSRALSQMAEYENFDLKQFNEVVGKGIEGLVNGKFIKVGSKSFVKPNEKLENGQLHVSINEVYRGVFSASYTYRSGLSALINSLKSKYKLTVLSGDGEAEQAKIANLFGSGAGIFFNQKPDEKHLAIQAAQLQGDRVCMIGDGINDAGALQTSNFGISVTDDINNFTPASDAIIKGDSLQDLNHFFDYAQSANKVVWWGFIISFTYNIVGLSFAVQGYLTPVVSAILMPLSSITVVVFATLAATWAARKNHIL